MTDFRGEYDERLPAINAAIDNMPGELEQFAPGLTRPRLKRIFQKLSVSLGKLDKSGAKHPEYLVFQGQPLPAALIAALDDSISHMASGAASFAGNGFIAIRSISDQLEKALGTDPTEIKRLNSSVANDLAAAVERSDQLLNKVASDAEAVSNALSSAKEQQGLLATIVDSIRNDAERAAESRRTLEQMVNPDGRSKTSLESLARRARQRITEVDEASANLQNTASKIETDAAHIQGSREQADMTVEELRKLQTEAEKILNLSSQAGLAASYKIESDRLQRVSWAFTAVLYASAVATLLIAAYWVIPGLEKAVGEDGKPVDLWKAISLSLLRAGALAPLVYILFFTTRRITSIEMLRMDYAEKAAASLSYSGYREQMNSDDDLLRQLKGSLLIKFSEHPERLLRPQYAATTTRVSTPGFEAESSVNPIPPDSQRRTGDGDSEEA